MRCPECGVEVRDGAQDCQGCGSPLRATVADGASNALDERIFGPETTTRHVAPRKRWVMPLVTAVISFVVVFSAAYVVLMLGEGITAETPKKRDVAVFYDNAQLPLGQSGSAQMRVRVPKGTGDATVVNEKGDVVAVLKQTDMEDSGDGYQWGVVDFPVDTSKVGTQHYAVLTGDDEVTDDEGQGNAFALEVIPSEPVPVVEQEWVLAEACDWVDETYGSKGTGSKVAKALVEHLKSDDRVASAKAYGTAVMFSTTTGVLHCISLAPTEEGLLGARDGGLHSYSESDPALEAFGAYRQGKSIEPGYGITAGNTITSGDVLLLEPTPERMDSAVSKRVQKACKTYASTLNGHLSSRKGDEVLSTILSGSLSEAGVVVLRAHGIQVKDTQTSLIQMRAKTKGKQDSWDVMNKDLSKYIDSLESDSTQDVWSSFLGEAGGASDWQSAITARATGTEGSWDVGVSVTTNLIRRCYQGAEFEQSILWLASCGSLADPSFAEFALSHGAQIVHGYKSTVSEQEDAQTLCEFLEGLNSDSAEVWRSQSVVEALGDSAEIGTASEEEVLTTKGNTGLFAQGQGTLEGRVVNGEGNLLEDVEIEVYRYFGSTYTFYGNTVTDADGLFAIDDLPCGRYVLEASAKGESKSVTIVLDEESVDGGDVELDAEQSPNSTYEDNTQDKEESQEPENENRGNAAKKGEGKERENEASESPVDIGAGNLCATADSKYFYVAINPSGVTDESASVPYIVRVSRKDLDTKVIWEAEQEGTIHQIALQEDRLLMFAHAGVESQILSMSTDGTGVKTLVSVNMPGGINANKLFAVANDRLVYVTLSGDNWRLSSRELDGFSDKTLCEGLMPFAGDAPVPEILSATNDRAVLAIPIDDDDYKSAVSVCSVSLDGKGVRKEIVRQEHANTSQVVGNRLFTVEGNQLVSYPIGNGDKEVVGSMPTEVKSGSVCNVNNRYAFVQGETEEDGESNVWRIGLHDGDSVSVSEDLGHVEINLVDNDVITCNTNGMAELRDLDFEVTEKLDASDSTSSEGESETVDPVSLVAERAGMSVAWSDTADYDGDGAKETFALTGEWYGSASTGQDAYNKPVVWYVSSSGAVSQVYQVKSFGYVNGVFDDPGDSGYRLLSIEATSGGSGSGSVVFGVKNGTAMTVNSVGRDLQVVKGRIMAAHDECVRNAGHKLNWYALSFDAESFSLNEGEFIATTDLFSTPE